MHARAEQLPREEHMTADPTTPDVLADDDLEPVADETARQAQRVVAAYAETADECRMLLSMLGIGPAEKY
jgi:hypothetical protein